MEAAAEEKSEYRDGKIVPMTGGSTDRNDITENLYAHLKFTLPQQPYKIFIADVRLWIPSCRCVGGSISSACETVCENSGGVLVVEGL